MTINEWNAIPKDKATNTQARKGDLCTMIDGVAFMVQRTNDFNNVICIRTKPATQSLLKTFSMFRSWCEENKLQYIRVEGIGKHSYKMLFLVLRLAPKTADVVKAIDESIEFNRHIFYVKTY